MQKWKLKKQKPTHNKKRLTSLSGVFLFLLKERGDKYAKDDGNNSDPD